MQFPFLILAAISLGLLGCGRIGFKELEQDPPTQIVGQSDGAVDEGGVFSQDGELTTDTPGETSDAASPEDASVPNDASIGDADTEDADTEDADTEDATSGDELAPEVCLGASFSDPTPIPGLETIEDSWGPSLSNDGLTLYYAVGDSQAERIAMATRPDTSSAFDTFSSPFDTDGNSELANLLERSHGTPFIEPNDLNLWFYVSDADNKSNRDLWLATRDDPSEPFRAAQRAQGISTNGNEHVPKVFDSGLTLSYSSNRSDGAGQSDVWLTTRSDTDKSFGEPSPWTELNTPYFDSSASLSPEGLLVVLISDRPGSVGGKDIWYATRESLEDPFSTPQNAENLSSTGSENDTQLSLDGRLLLFSSSREGKRLLWQAERICD